MSRDRIDEELMEAFRQGRTRIGYHIETRASDEAFIGAGPGDIVYLSEHAEHGPTGATIRAFVIGCSPRSITRLQVVRPPPE